MNGEDWDDRLLRWLLKRLRTRHRTSGGHPWVPLKDKQNQWVVMVCPCGEYKMLVDIVLPAKARVRS